MEPFWQLMTIMGFGLLLGLEHALEADHVVAVSTLVTDSKSIRHASWLGLMWGVGHTAALLFVGVLILVFKVALPARLALSFEFLVGALLVALGVNVLRKVVGGQIHLHRHQHTDGRVHTHLHSHARSEAHQHQHRSFLVGLLHGLAGSAALTLLALSSLDSVAQGIVFIVVFGVGSIVGMLLMGAVIGLIFKAAVSTARLTFATHIIAGIVSIALGTIIMYEIGLVGGLFG